VEFVYFYSMGRLFNEYPASQIYNYELQKEVCTEVRRRRRPMSTAPIPFTQLWASSSGHSRA